MNANLEVNALLEYSIVPFVSTCFCITIQFSDFFNQFSFLLVKKALCDDFYVLSDSGGNSRFLSMHDQFFTIIGYCYICLLFLG